MDWFSEWEWTDQRKSECMSEWVSEWVSKCAHARLYEWMNLQVNEWISECVRFINSLNQSFNLACFSDYYFHLNTHSLTCVLSVLSDSRSSRGCLFAISRRRWIRKGVDYTVEAYRQQSPVNISCFEPIGHPPAFFSGDRHAQTSVAPMYSAQIANALNLKRHRSEWQNCANGPLHGVDCRQMGWATDIIGNGV